MMFLCCCPWRKSPSTNGSENDGEVKDISQVEDGIQPKIILDGKNSRVSVTELVKKMEKSPGEESRLIKPQKKAPENKAFQDFENAGIIIGMGKAPKLQNKGPQNGRSKDEFEIPVEILSKDDPDSPTNKKNNNSTKVTVTQNTSTTSVPNKQGTETVTTVTRTVSTALPDVVHSTSLDEEDEFAAIERNSEILSSFRKPPPPSRRSKGKRPARKPSSTSLNQSGDPSLNEWSGVLDSFSFGPPMASSVTQYKKVTRQVLPDGSVVETTETSSGPVRKQMSQPQLKLTSSTIVEVDEPTELYPNDDTMCETLKRTRKLSTQRQHFAYDDSDMGTLKRKRQGERLVKHFPVGKTPVQMTKSDKQMLTSASRKVSNHKEPRRGALILDKYGNLVLNGQAKPS